MAAQGGMGWIGWLESPSLVHIARRRPSLTSHLPYYGPISHHPPWRRPLPKNVGKIGQAPRMTTYHQHLSTYHDANLSTDVRHKVNQVGSGGRGASQNKQLRSAAEMKEGNDHQGEYWTAALPKKMHLPEVLNVIFKLFQLQHVTHWVAVQEGLSAGAPVDVCQ